MNSQLPGGVRARLTAGLVAPLVAYLILRQAVGSSTGALEITEAIPVALMAMVALVRRQLAPVAAISVIVFGFALAITALSGSSSPLKLRRSGFTGVVGVARLLSLALRKPLLIAALPLIARIHPESADAIDDALRDPVRRRTLKIATGIFCRSSRCCANRAGSATSRPSRSRRPSPLPPTAPRTRLRPCASGS